jgi:hypothetical protein
MAASTALSLESADANIFRKWANPQPDRADVEQFASQRTRLLSPNCSPPPSFASRLDATTSARSIAEDTTGQRACAGLLVPVAQQIAQSPANGPSNPARSDAFICRVVVRASVTHPFEFDNDRGIRLC